MFCFHSFIHSSFHPFIHCFIHSFSFYLLILFNVAGEAAANPSSHQARVGSVWVSSPEHHRATHRDKQPLTRTFAHRIYLERTMNLILDVYRLSEETSYYEKFPDHTGKKHANYTEGASLFPPRMLLAGPGIHKNLDSIVDIIYRCESLTIWRSILKHLGFGFDWLFGTWWNKTFLLNSWEMAA